MKTNNEEIKFNKGNQKIKEIKKKYGKQLFNEIREMAKKYMCRLKNEVMEKRNFDIDTFRETDKVVSIEDSKFIYSWFIKICMEIIGCMKFEIVRSINNFNARSNMKVSLEEVENEPFLTGSIKEVQNSIRSVLEGIINRNFIEDGIVFFGDLGVFNTMLYKGPINFVTDYGVIITQKWHDKYFVKDEKFKEEISITLANAIKNLEALSIVVAEKDYLLYGKEFANALFEQYCELDAI